MRWALLLAPLLPLQCVPAQDSPETPATMTELRTLLAQPLAQLQAAQTSRGRFTQLKHLAGFPRPLRSTGDFLFARGLGVVWRTAEPIPSEFVLDASGIRDRANGGAAIDAHLQPGLRLVSDVFLALFMLDLEALATRFQMSVATEGSVWRLLLPPRDPAFETIAQRLVLSGREHIDRIELIDARGDRTEILLHDFATGTDPPSVDERTLFAP